LRVEKKLFLGIVMSAAAVLGAEEVVHLSRLEKPASELQLHRDLFRREETRMPAPSRVRPEPIPVEAETRKQAAADATARVQRSIVYEGYIQRNGRLTAILSVDGEYFVAAAGEQLLDHLSVQALDQDQLVVLVDGKRHEIPFQGVGNNEP